MRRKPKRSCGSSTCAFRGSSLPTSAPQLSKPATAPAWSNGSPLRPRRRRWMISAATAASERLLSPPARFALLPRLLAVPTLALLIDVPGGAAADLAGAEQLRGQPLDGFPVG